MITKDLYKRLEAIFIDYTTHQWKNGWEHEGDRLSKEYTIQENIPWNNLFLLQKTNNYIYGEGILLDGPRGFKIELHNEDSNRMRIDIEVKQMGIDIFYYVDNELDWLAHQDFIVNLCQNVYDANLALRNAISVIPNNIYGNHNPNFAQSFRRER